MQRIRFIMEPGNIKFEYLNGAYSELANLLGIEAVLKIHSAYRGQQITFFLFSCSAGSLLKSKLLKNITAIISNNLLRNTATAKSG